MKFLKKIIEVQRRNLILERCYHMQELIGNTKACKCIIQDKQFCKKCKYSKSLKKRFDIRGGKEK